MTDWATLYREHVADVSALTRDLTDEQRTATVPGSPRWTVHEVVAHLAGVSADGVAGRTEGAPGPEWTERHVAERRDTALPDLVAELQSHQDAVVGSFEAGKPQGIVFDIATHHADLHEALGKHRLAEPLWRPVLDAVSPRLDPALVAVVPPYELFRGFFSRRSRAQMAAWDTGLSAAQLDAVGVFGPRDDDQPVPADPSVGGGG